MIKQMGVSSCCGGPVCPLLSLMWGVMQGDPRTAFAGWVHRLQKAYKDNAEVPALISFLLCAVCNPPPACKGAVPCFSEVNRYKRPPFLQEYERRFRVWLDNLEYAHSHNEKPTSFRVSCSSLGLLKSWSIRWIDAPLSHQDCGRPVFCC